MSLIRRFLLCCCSKQYIHDSKLTKLSNKNTCRWIVPFRRAKVVDVYDGDTLTLAAFIENKPYRFRCRLAKIDAPELRPNGSLSSAEYTAELKLAVLSKMALTNMALGNIVTLYDVKTEKWGRILADLVVDGTTETLSDRMLKCRMAIPYDGGKKDDYSWKNHKYPNQFRWLND